MIEKTNDYSVFKKHENNREICESNVTKIMKSIQMRNLLEYRPVLVDAKMRIVDGQHRLEAAKRLGIPVFYEIKDDINKEDIIILNDNSKVWSRDDYLNYWCAERNKEYLKLRDFIKKYNLSLSLAFSVLGMDTIKGGGRASPFKLGKFIFPSAVEEISSVKILQNSQEFINYIGPKLEGYHNYIHGPIFRRALYIFLSIKAVEFDVFMEKTSYRLDLIRPCSRIGDFVRIFKIIYNFRNRNPITLDEME